jgi:hypothetical protein
MSMLKEYLAKTERTFNYRIKTVVPLEDDFMDIIERTLAKYVPLNIGRVHKTILQQHPLDFPGVDNAEVYFVDVTLTLAASSYILQQDIRYALKIPEKFIVVRGENEPTEVETQRLNAFADMEAEAAKKGLKVAALIDTPEYPEGQEVTATDYYGDEYNSRLTGYLAKLASERDLEVKAPNAPKPFKWLEPKDQEPGQPTDNFNDHITGKKKRAAPASASGVSRAGNLDDNTRTYKKTYTTKAGKEKVLSQTGIAVDKKKGK